MLPANELRQALYDKGYRELRSVHDKHLRLTLMTDVVHILVLQEYIDGSAELYAPLGTMNNLQATIDAIPVIHSAEIRRATP